ncbi:MAG TPA: hypothetical protein VEC99_09275, partial [Clostridia bacterium]|nr:hypothetical protein [Clostridia bacterium]
FRDGFLDHIYNGSFSPSGLPLVNPPIGGTNNPPVTNSPPASPVGYTFTMFRSQTPDRLVFQTATAGIEFDDSGPSGFTFTYTASGPNTVRLIVQFKPDRWDDYELVFSGGAQGQFVRRRYDRNALKDTDSGPFTVAPTN